MKEIDFRTVSFIKALANHVRYMIIIELSKKSRTVSELARILKRRISVISQHLRILRQERLVSFRTKNNSVTYSLRNRKVVEIIETIKTLLKRK